MPACLCQGFLLPYRIIIKICSQLSTRQVVQEGAPLLDAVCSAGIARFRPIALTSVTTYAGLVPLMFEANPQATMMIPMAISLGYGVLVASVFTLFLVPALYVVLEDVRALLPRVRRSLSGGGLPDSAA